jgi:Kef-type K+ transport system membrane component KefB
MMHGLMIGEPFIRDLGLMVVGAALFGLLARRLRLPGLVAYLLVGLVLGPLTGLVRVSEVLHLISEAGIVLLLFLVGMELSFEKIRGMGRAVLWAGFGQVLLTFGLGWLFCQVLGMRGLEALFLAVALTFSSTVVAVKLLEEKHELGLLHGRLTVGVLLIQDLVAIVLLTLLGAFGPEAETDLEAVLGVTLHALAAMLGLVALVLALSRYVLPSPFAWAARSPSTMLIWSLCWCFFVVALALHLHLSPETGAFLAGVALAQLPFNRDLRRRVHPLMSFFVAVFFVSLGAQMPLASALDRWPTVLALIAFAVVVKFCILMLLLARIGFGQRTAHQTATSLSQISEFSIIIAAVGEHMHWISKDLLSLIGVTGLVTFSISACVIIYSSSVYRSAARWGLLRLFRAREETEVEERHASRRNHVIIVGMNSLGRRLVDRFLSRGDSVLAIDTDPAKLTNLGCETLHGNVEYLSLLEEADLPRARLLISALQIEPTNDLLAYRCRSFDVPCAILVVDLSLAENLLEMDVDYMMVPKVDGIKLQLRELEQRGFLHP